MRAESLLALVAVLAAASAGAADDATLIVANGKVIVGDGTVLERGTVVVAGDRILAVRADPVDAAAAKLIDATGKTVMPGLIDAHVHLTMEKLFEQPRDDEAMESFVAGGLPERLRGFLEAGITTVMSPGDYWPAAVGVRDAVSTGELAGPRIRTAGRLLTAPGGHPAATFCGSLDMKGPNPWCREHLTEEVATEGEAREAVARLAGEGVDLVKFVYEDLGEPGVEPLAGELVDDIIAAAHGHEFRNY